MVSRKAQGIGINTLILAALAILVLIIIGVLVGRGGGDLDDAANACAFKGGQCSENNPGGVDSKDWSKVVGACELQDGTVVTDRCWRRNLNSINS